jgi:hypothetical protein
VVLCREAGTEHKSRVTRWIVCMKFLTVLLTLPGYLFTRIVTLKVQREHSCSGPGRLTRTSYTWIQLEYAGESSA